MEQFTRNYGEQDFGLTPPKISVCIPTWKDAANALLSMLSDMPASLPYEVLIYDDGSADPALTSKIEHCLKVMSVPATLITAKLNRGRSHARNRLTHHARAEWILLLDADMLPDEQDFLQNYCQYIGADSTPALIAGGFTLKQVTASENQLLHAAQSKKSECLSAAERSENPGLHVFTSNILVHREILDRVYFDEGYVGWGWEDVDWGLRVARQYSVKHIDNTATHLGLDDAAILIRKYQNSSANFARLVHNHPEEVIAMQLYQVSKRLAAIPGRGLIRGITKLLAEDPIGLVPLSIRLFSLKMFRAATYAEDLK